MSIDADTAVPRQIVMRSGAGPTAGVMIAGDTCVTGLVSGQNHGPDWGGLMPWFGRHALCIAGLECPLTTSDDVIVKVGPHLRGASGLATVLREGGFHAVSLANNHIMDCGAAGLGDTLEACRRAGLLAVGAGMDLEAARTPLVVIAAGFAVAVLAVAEREFSIAGRESPGAAPLDPWATPDQVRAAREAADVVVVVVHGGNEYFPLPRPGLVSACRALVDAGAHAVVCHHSHVPGPYEVYRGAPIVYGLGNFCFPARGDQPAAWYHGYVVGLSLDQLGVRSFEIMPNELSRRGVSVQPLEGPALSAFFDEIDDLRQTLADQQRLDAAWQFFCAGRRPDVIARALGLTRVERRLLCAGLWPSWRLPRRRLPELLNLLNCDSHREVLESLVQAEVDR